MRLIEYTDEEMLAINVANRLAGDLNTALDHDDRALFVVPGGTTPGAVFDVLCDADLDWSRVDICLSDERWVPEVHIRSNTKMLRERLLVGRAAKATYVPLYLRAEAPEAVIEQLEADLQPRLPISVLLLGMGADMHTASLFPGAEGLDTALSRDAPALVPVRAKTVEDVRLSLSARVLNAAVVKHIVITGADKRKALERARTCRPEQAPVAAILDETDVHWAP
ncbi:MAG: 6-phosphogluconolactonase [Roseovarius sp.]